MKKRATPTLSVLADIRDAFNELTKTVREYQQAAKHEEEKEIRAESETVKQFLVAVTEHYRAKNSERGEASSRDRWRVWLERIGVLAAIVLAILTWCTLSTQKAEWEAEHRPWVGNGEIGFSNTQFVFYPGNPIQNKTQFNVTIDVPIKNSGIEPAIHVGTGMYVFVDNEIPAPRGMDTYMQTACRQADSYTKLIGEALFPNSDAIKVEWPIDTGTPFPEITDIRRVWVFICVAYSSVRQPEKLHHTKIWAASWPITGQPRESGRTTSPPVVYYNEDVKWVPVVKTEAD